MRKVAVLDEKNALVGKREVEKLTSGDIPLSDNSDLPLDGSMTWGGESFHQTPRPRPSRKEASPFPVAMRAFFQQWKNDGNTVPEEVERWCEWFDQKHPSKKAQRRARR